MSRPFTRFLLIDYHSSWLLRLCWPYSGHIAQDALRNCTDSVLLATLRRCFREVFSCAHSMVRSNPHCARCMLYRLRMSSDLPEPGPETIAGRPVHDGPVPAPTQFSTRPLPPIEYLSASSITVVDAHRPGGTSDSIGLVAVTGCEKLFLAKSNIVRAPSHDPLKLFLQEICSNDIYAYFGCHAQQLAICPDLPWILGSNCWRRNRRTKAWRLVEAVDAGECDNPARSHFLIECSGTHAVDPVEESGGRAVAPHLIAQWIDGFQPFDEQLIAQLCSGSNGNDVAI